MSTGDTRELVVLPAPSTAFVSGVTAVDEGGAWELWFEFDREGVIYRSGLRFEKARAYRWRAEGHCRVWHVEDAYDTLVEVTPSDWVRELTLAEPAETWGTWVMHHFMIFIDGEGCYEVVAESWVLMPETRLEPDR